MTFLNKFALKIKIFTFLLSINISGSLSWAVSEVLETEVYAAIEDGDIEKVRLLVFKELDGACSDSKFSQRQKYKFFSYAIKKSKLEIARVWVENFILAWSMGPYRQFDKDLLLREVVEAGDVKLVAILLTQGIEENRPRADAEGGRLLSIAAYSGHLHIVKFFLMHGPKGSRAKANARESDALFIALRSRALDVADFLLNEGPRETRAKADARNSYGIELAIRERRPDILKFLFRQADRPKPNAGMDAYEQNYMSLAMCYKNVEILEMLLTRGPLQDRLVPFWAGKAMLAQIRESIKTCGSGYCLGEILDLLELYLPNILIYRELPDELSIEDDCPICKEALKSCLNKEGQTVKACALRCGHLFHMQCVDSWFQKLAEHERPKECPICNQSAESIQKPHSIRPYAGQTN